MFGAYHALVLQNKWFTWTALYLLNEKSMLTTPFSNPHSFFQAQARGHEDSACVHSISMEMREESICMNYSSSS